MNILLIFLSFVAFLAAIEAALRTRDQFVSKYAHFDSATISPRQAKTVERAILEPEIEPYSVNEPVNNVSNITSEIVSSDPSFLLATSLTISESLDESLHPEKLTIPDLYPDYPVEAESPTHAHHAPDVLQEIAQLEQVEPNERIAHLAQHLQHPDSALRGAIAATLGELFPKTHGSDRQELIRILTQLSQDANVQVRVQAAAALGKANVI
ncbi:HEAT repeat domain-containing protein [Myxacorys almedinensis]|uniref:HEAT repeat domain-containing protein n=1 Tax=Myxacorys almedinensis A TaxID=2690445 RepID=A0A8J7Z6W0_9CYAN|nr:HEAT repeat domain-containing protein [Myxacorys almedinensis]NDJ16590.1 hypothetical protein [Myxacorys almedinensis A]